MDILPPDLNAVKSGTRDWLAARLRRAEVPDWLWEELSVGEFLNGPPAALVREAKRRLRAIRAPGSGPQSQQLPNIDELLTPAEAGRAWAFSEHISGLAASDRDIQSFRSKYLDAQTLTESDAMQFLASEALLHFSAAALRPKGIPVRGHKVLKRDIKSGPVDRPWGRMWRLDAHVEIAWQNRTESIDAFIERSPGSTDLPTLHLPSGEGWFPFTVWPDSVYDELRQITQALVTRFPWNEPEATKYVLTGETPFIPPIYVHPINPKIGTPGHLSMTISIEPWVSAQTVTRLYKVLKTALYPGGSRAMSEKNLALFRFVTRHARPGEEIPSFEHLLKLWNEEQKEKPEWQYRSAWTFARDYRRTGHMVVFPRYPKAEEAKPAGGNHGARDRGPKNEGD